MKRSRIKYANMHCKSFPISWSQATKKKLLAPLLCGREGIKILGVMSVQAFIELLAQRYCQ